MTVAELLSRLRELDVKLWVEEDRLKCNAPQGVLTPELRETLASRKTEIIEFLRRARIATEGPRGIVPLKPEGRKPPLFAIPSHNGDVFCYVALSHRLDADQPIYGVQPPGLDGSEPIGSLEELAAYDVAQIRSFQPRGPYLLAGYCAGGTIAFEVACQLTEQGHQVALLALFGSPYPGFYRWRAQPAFRVRDLLSRVGGHLRTVATAPLADGIEYLRDKLRRRREKRSAQVEALQNDPVEVHRYRVGTVTLAGIRAYRPRRLAGQIDIFLPSQEWSRSDDRLEGWRTLAARVCEHVGPDGCDGDTMLKEPWVATIAELLRPRLEEIARHRDE